MWLHIATGVGEIDVGVWCGFLCQVLVKCVTVWILWAWDISYACVHYTDREEQIVISREFKEGVVEPILKVSAA